jgi:cytochrome c oxidase cbb3-type subunit 3
MSSPSRSALAVLGPALLLLLATTACEREDRQFRNWPPAAGAATVVRESPLQPGPPTPNPPVHVEYANNAWAVSQGQQLYNQFNCSGCHFQGGGGIGPPLMDSQWIYGSAPQNIFETIVEGRPNGMPSFRGRLGNDQVWKLVYYVRSMSGLLPKDVAPGRTDNMQVRPQEQVTKKAVPVQSFLPPTSE